MNLYLIKPNNDDIIHVKISTDDIDTYSLYSIEQFGYSFIDGGNNGGNVIVDIDFDIKNHFTTNTHLQLRHETIKSYVIKIIRDLNLNKILNE